MQHTMHHIFILSKINHNASHIHLQILLNYSRIDYVSLSLMISLLGSVGKAGKEVAPQVNNGRNHLWKNQVSDGFMIK